MGKIFLTGATGFVGAHVLRALLDADQAVYALVQPGIDRWRIADLLSHPGLTLVEGDLLNAGTWAGQVEQIRPQTCIHLAWYAEHGRYWTAIENLDMLSASLELVRLLIDRGCERFVGVGTCVEYDTTQEEYLSEDSALRPASLYAASKLSLYYLLEQLSHTAGMQTAWLRFFYLYGPMEDERRLVPYVIRTLLRGEPVKTTSGEQVRDYLHVEDVASAVWSVTRSDLTGAVNIGSGQPTTIYDLVTTLGRLVGREDLLRPGAIPLKGDEPMYLCADNQKLRSTGWNPRYDLNVGLRQTIAWWRQHDDRG